MTVRDILPQTFRAPELYGDFWFNSGPVPVTALRGQVILIEFWDYTSEGSLRTLPYLKEWETKYKPYGLVLLGVHSPRYPFGKDPRNVQEGIQRLGIRFPVVMDNEGTLAVRYSCARVPTIVLIDKDGFVRFESAGEGNYQGIEHVLQSLLYNAGVGEELPIVMEPVRESDKPGAIRYRTTPELFTGYGRGSIGNVEGYNPESIVGYTDPGIYLTGRFYIDGPWLNARDCVQLRGDVGHIIIDYEALEVSAVLKTENATVVEALVEQDGRPLPQAECGDDVKVTPQGQSVLTIGSPRSYHIVRNSDHGKHVLRLTLNSNGLSVYGFAFVSGAMSEVYSNS